MTDQFPDKPTGVKLVLPTGDSIYLEMEPGPTDPHGIRLWMAYGPAGMVIPPGSQIAYDDLPTGVGIGVALERNVEDGAVRFADRVSFQALEQDPRCDGQLPPPGQGWN